MRGAHLLAALGAVTTLAACGAGQGAPRAAAPATAAPATQAPPPLPPGWVTIDGGRFTARLPASFQHKTREKPGAPPDDLWTASKDGVDYVVGAPAGKVDAAPDEAMAASARSFFKGCGGELTRSRRNDTLRVHTLSVVGTCRTGPAIGEVHAHDGGLELLFVVITGREDDDMLTEEDVKGFFRAFQVNPS
jgi:hypothetical protein